MWVINSLEILIYFFYNLIIQYSQRPLGTNDPELAVVAV